MKKRQPLQHESSRVLDSLVIRAPVLQTVVGEVSDDVEPLLGRDVPMLLLLDLFENPRLDKSTPAHREKAFVLYSCVRAGFIYYYGTDFALKP